MLHQLPDEEFEIDPTDVMAVQEYLAAAEATHCRDLCEQCGQRHGDPCPNTPRL